MDLCEFDEEIIHEGVDELKTDLSDYMLLSDAFVKEPRFFTITSSDASLIRLMGSDFLPLNDKIGRVLLQRPFNSKNGYRFGNSNQFHSPVLPEHVAVPSAADVPVDAHLRTHAGGKRVGSALFPDPVIELPDCHAGLDDGDVVLDIDGDAPEVEEVEDDEWLVRDVGDALEVVAAASDFDLDWDGFGADDGGLDVGFVKRGYDE
ncbi:putative 6-phosphogluconolactonase 1 [Senna tora]|uniref:Putative 6-phosphogluconolactonase 1 n=1 Tax=Senna tora TaxID=362788 RepID=A0A834WZM7_9FABA|nr:putative 6-phosphogluconolactonase 1 [Senna tora]